VQLLEVLHQLICSRERDVRAIPELHRTVGTFLSLDDLRWLETIAADAVDRIVEQRAVVGEINGNRRRAGADHAPHVAVVDQVLQHLAEEVADARRLLKVHVEVVNEQKEHASRRVVGRPRDRQDDPFLNRRRRRRERVVRAATVNQHHRRELLLLAVFEDVKVGGLQIGDELIGFRITNDDVGRHEVGARAERRRLLLLLLLLRLLCGRLCRPALRVHGCVAHAEGEDRQGKRKSASHQELSGVSHGHSIRHLLPMHLAIGSDHAGFAYKEVIKAMLASEGHTVKDFGTNSEAPVDYPDFVRPVAEAVAKGEYERGIVLGGSGNGEAMVANRICGIRCGLCWNEQVAIWNRSHNDANMLSLGQRTITEAEALAIVRIWLVTPFEGGRHIARIRKIDQPCK
jgi:ribose 5-phosphate isomerase B